ncbi:hypothetical protein HanXRQr2_Chr06g0245201 [Helianthus annuus]|uniref:Uncharacterized protein n=1 Tax=Helianthus annuus TaxID=4232 RepID=A0A9K3IQZ6_HELAN|nr:hypothetical protein HanXRQr2_Chr06g0245201 [Helianthus annuus]
MVLKIAFPGGGPLSIIRDNKAFAASISLTLHNAWMTQENCLIAYFLFSISSNIFNAK